MTDELVDLIEGVTLATFLFTIVNLVRTFNFLNGYMLRLNFSVSRINCLSGVGDNGRPTLSCVGDAAKLSPGRIPSAKVTRLDNLEMSGLVDLNTIITKLMFLKSFRIYLT